MAAKAGYNWDAWQQADLDHLKRVSPAAERNKQAILEELRKHLPAAAAAAASDGGSSAQPLVLEVASGTGQHISHFAAALDLQLRWQPSDVTDELFDSIKAYCVEQPNVLQPLVLDARAPVEHWPLQGPAAAVITANLTHISPWRVTLGLVAGAGKLLQRGGCLCIYGPFTINNQFTSDSNRQFHETLIMQNPEWGYRDVADIAGAAEAAGLQQEHCVSMPANNFMLVFKKS